jgi:large subunit ribosomal protein L14
MIQLKTILNVIDNSGARLVECVNVLGRKTIASLGDEIVVVVRKARPISDAVAGSSSSSSSSATLVSKLKKGEVGRAVVVRCRKEVRRPDGTYIKFDDNACVMLNAKGEPMGNRVMGVIANEVRQKKWAKVVSLAPKTL